LLFFVFKVVKNKKAFLCGKAFKYLDTYKTLLNLPDVWNVSLCALYASLSFSWKAKLGKKINKSSFLPIIS